MRNRLEEDLGDFEARHRQLKNNIPAALRSMTVEEFAVKYDGNITRFMEDATTLRMAAGVSVDIEASTRKRSVIQTCNATEREVVDALAHRKQPIEDPADGRMSFCQLALPLFRRSNLHSEPVTRRPPPDVYSLLTPVTRREESLLRYPGLGLRPRSTHKPSPDHHALVNNHQPVPMDPHHQTNLICLAPPLARHLQTSSIQPYRATLDLA